MKSKVLDNDKEDDFRELVEKLLLELASGTAKIDGTDQHFSPRSIACALAMMVGETIGFLNKNGNSVPEFGGTVLIGTLSLMKEEDVNEMIDQIFDGARRGTPEPRDKLIPLYHAMDKYFVEE